MSFIGKDRRMQIRSENSTNSEYCIDFTSLHLSKLYFMFIFIRLWSYMVWNYGGHNKKVRVARDAKEESVSLARM